MEVVFNQNDMVFKLQGFKDTVSGNYLNAATVTMRIYDGGGTEVTGISWPQTLVYIAASNGDYAVTIDKAIVLVSGKRYVAKIDAVEGTIDAHWEIPFIVRIRR